MVAVLIVGALTTTALVAGSAVAVRFDVPDRVLALALAVAAGALIAAAAFELFEPAVQTSSPSLAVIGLLAGAAFFAVTDRLIDRRFDPSRGRSPDDHRGNRSSGLSMLLAVVVDGVPESMALGATSRAGGGTAAVVAAIVLSNLPEAMNGSNAMRAAGRSATSTVGLWTITGFVLAAAIGAGYVLLPAHGQPLAIALSVAAGGVIASLADTLMPMAYRYGESWVGLATAIGFTFAYGLAPTAS